jgi:hypothetical protein
MLQHLCDKYSLDKTSTKGSFHEYVPGYDSILNDYRFKVKNVLEIGIGCVECGQMSGVVSLGYRTGNSLRMWKEYFPNALIYGMDIFPEAHISEDRIKTFVADQSNAESLDRCIKEIENHDMTSAIINKDSKGIDIIIDDGSHDPEHQKFSFMHLEKYLSENGIYFIEDIQPPYNENFINHTIWPPSFQNYLKENYEITVFDTRHVRGRSDDVLICYKKKPKKNLIKSVLNKDNQVFYLQYTTEQGLISEYYLYCVKLFKEVILNNKSLNKGFHYFFDLTQKESNLGTLGSCNKCVRIQYEHTLVKQGGRSSENAEVGNVYDGENFYLVRVESKEVYEQTDIIIEYSYLNMINLVLSGCFQNHLNKTIHIAPIIYNGMIDDILNHERNVSKRSLDVLTTFINTFEPRRAQFLGELYNNNINTENHNNCWETPYDIDSWDDNYLNRKIIKLYNSAKILVNIHQTDHHHTLEELRVLPALTSGIIVISEPVPMMDAIPYHNFIIWSTMDNMVNTIKKILENYSQYVDSHSIRNKDLRKILNYIHESNKKNIEHQLNGLLVLKGGQDF